MRTLAFVVEQNIRQPGRTILQSWREIPGATFQSMAAAVEFSFDFDLKHGRKVPTRVLERVALANGTIVENQVFPHWDAKVRTFSARRSTVDLDWERRADADQDPVAAAQTDIPDIAA